MPERIRPIDSYTFIASDKLLFDANVWLFLYSPQYREPDQREKAYSTALKRMLDARCAVFIDAIVLSEFVNVLARLAYNSMPARSRPSDFKAFRQSSSFKPVAKSITDSCRHIFRIARPIESSFPSLDLDDLLQQYESGRRDLNDLLLAHLCRIQSLTLVTDDGDFHGSGLVILTANPRLLR